MIPDNFYSVLIRPSSEKFLFFGSRSYQSREFVEYACDLVLEKHGRFVMVNGMCPTGADKFAYDWAIKKRISIETYSADWVKYGKAAGPIRNKQMSYAGLTGAVMFGNGKGTRNMRGHLKDRNVPVWTL